MAYFGPPKGSEEPNNYTPEGQRHDRLSDDNDDKPSVPITPSGTTSSDVDTSITQKMLSAVTGSILTSLLGES